VSAGRPLIFFPIFTMRIERPRDGAFWVYLSLIVSGVGAFCISNFPRAWWEEVVSSTAPVWCSFFVVILIVQLRNFKIAPPSFLVALAIGCEVFCVASTIRAVWPYVYYRRSSDQTQVLTQPLSVMFIDHPSQESGEGPPNVSRLIARLNPDLLVVLGDAGGAPTSVASEHGLRCLLASQGGSTGEITLCSRLPVMAEPDTDFGYGALPGVFGSLRVDRAVVLELGVLDLLPTWSQDSFGASRVTSRRLATLMKFSDNPRVVMGAFRSSPTSQIAKMYVEEVHLNSIFFDGGLTRLVSVMKSALGLGHGLGVFTARSIVTAKVLEYSVARDGFSGISFEMRVPKGAYR